MADLFGEDFSELLSQSGDIVSLSSIGNNTLDLSNGSVFVWSTDMKNALESQSLKGRLEVVLEQLNEFRRKKSRNSDPLVEFAAEMFIPDTSPTMVSELYRFSTRNEILKRLKNKGVISDATKMQDRVLSGRIVNDLIEYNLIRPILQSAGPRPAIYAIIYPFKLIEPVIEKPIPPKNEIDLSEFGDMIKLDEETLDTQILDIRRLIFHKGRPHEHITQDGTIIDFYEREAVVYDPSSGDKRTIQLTSESYSAVMTKRDENVWSYVKNWCLHQIKDRRRRNVSLNDWFVLTPELVMDMMGAAGTANLNQVREMMVRWKDTRITAERVHDIKGNDGDTDGEFINYVTGEIGIQFADAETAWKTLKDGSRALKAIAFTLPPNLQKELERRAEHDRETEESVSGISKYLTITGNRSLLNDSFAMAVDNFFWRVAKRYSRTPKGWHSELWTGFSEIFDFDFANPPLNIPRNRRRSIIDNNKKLFLRCLNRFFNAFSNDPIADYKTFMSYEGGIIRITVINFDVIITLKKRGKREAQKGTVSIKPTSKLLSQTLNDEEAINDNSESTDLAVRLINSGISKKSAKEIMSKNSNEVILKAVELTNKMNEAGQILKTPAAFLYSILKDSPTIEMLESNIAGLNNLKNNKSVKEARAELTRSIMDLDNTSWAD